jgi:ApaG domain
VNACLGKLSSQSERFYHMTYSMVCSRIQLPFIITPLLSVCSTRLALLSEREQRECGVARPVARVQLKSRHWRIRTIKGELVDEVVGDGVVGAHPVLEAGAPTLCCKPLRTSRAQSHVHPP